MGVGCGSRGKNTGFSFRSDLLSEIDRFFQIGDQMGVGKISDILVDAFAGLIREDVLVFRVCFYKVDKRGIVDATVHAADQESGGICDTGRCLNGGLRDRADRVVIEVDTIEVSDEFETVAEPGEGLDALSHLLGIETEDLGADTENEGRIELVMGTSELHIEVHRCIKIEPRFLSFGFDLRNVVSIVKKIFGGLVYRDILLCVKVILHRDITVEMVLIEVQEDRYMRRGIEV